MVLIVLRILIVLIEVLFVIDFKIARIMLMKPNVTIVGFFFRFFFFVENLISIDIHRPPISFQSKVILLTVLLMMISFDVFSILICYFCCGISSRNRLDVKEQKSTSRPFQRAFEILFILYI